MQIRGLDGPWRGPDVAYKEKAPSGVPDGA